LHDISPRMVTYSANSYPHGSFLPVESNARSESGTAWTCMFHCCVTIIVVVIVEARDVVENAIVMVLMKPRNTK
jgi:hypothetical protein